MKISIVTVCFNSSKTIGRTLRSVREQTYGEIEHIVIDGGSLDNTLEVVNTEGSHVHKLVSEKDNGIYDAMNKGVQLATGDVVAFLNSDDFYSDKEVLARVAKVMQAEHLDALYGNLEFFYPSEENSVARRYNSGRFTVAKLGCGWMPAHPALFVRKALFERHGLFRTEYRIAGDFEFIARVFTKPGLRHRHLAESLVRMQMGGISTSGWRATLLLNQEMLRACRTNAIPTSWLHILSRYPLKLLEFLQR